MKIGLIQTAGLGDIIIAVPIAKAFADAGHQVFWPVHEAYYGFLPDAVPYVTFIPVPRNDPVDFHLGLPRRELAARGCEKSFVLYNSLFNDPNILERRDLVEFLKFDEYKYAVAGIPFSEKWRLQLNRNLSREKDFHATLGITGPYVCVHRQSSDARLEFELPSSWSKLQVVEVDGRGTPFDWIYTFERAAKIVCVDSVFSNLVEQLNLPNDKTLFFRMPSPFCAVMKNGWNFVCANAMSLEPTGARA